MVQWEERETKERWGELNRMEKRKAIRRLDWMEVGWTALKLGLTSFGGPVAHIGYFREEYVVRKRWLSERAFADLTALCQFLPGPASSQLGISIGMQRAGWLGGIAAWLGFTLPSALLLVLFALGVKHGGWTDAGWLHGLKLVAVAVVAQAVWSMARTLAPDRLRATLAGIAAASALLLPGTIGQWLPLALGALAGWLWHRPPAQDGASGFKPVVRPAVAAGCLTLFVLLLFLLPLLAYRHPAPWLQLAASGYRAGSLVFGGGHVILPMLQQDPVVSSMLTDDRFLAGYGAAQAVPGPLFTFAAYVGAASASGTESWLRAGSMLLSVFLPSFLLIAGTMPFWARLRAYSKARAALAGVNASVVGLLLAAFYNPVWTSSVYKPIDFAAALAGFLLLTVWRCPPWVVAAGGAAFGFIAL